MDTSQDYDVSRLNVLIASNSILCGTIQKLEKRLAETHHRINVLENVIMDKDRQLDGLYKRMNELYHILQQKDAQLTHLNNKKQVLFPLNDEQMKNLHELSQQSNSSIKEDNKLPVIKVSAAKMLPLIPIPAYPGNLVCKSVPQSTMVPEVEIHEFEDPSLGKFEPSPSTSSPVSDRNKVQIVCVTRENNVIRAVTAQKSYVDNLKKKNEIDLKSIIIEVKCKQAQKLWEDTMKLCHEKYNNEVKLLRKSLNFSTTQAADEFANEIKHLYTTMNVWDTNKVFVLE